MQKRKEETEEKGRKEEGKKVVLLKDHDALLKKSSKASLYPEKESSHYRLVINISSFKWYKMMFSPQ